jgi:hypothetical protein
MEVDLMLKQHWINTQIGFRANTGGALLFADHSKEIYIKDITDTGLDKKSWGPDVQDFAAFVQNLFEQLDKQKVMLPLDSHHSNVSARYFPGSCLDR